MSHKMSTTYLPISTRDIDHDLVSPTSISPRSHFPTYASPIHMATTTLKVEGMTCGACTSAVESGFKDVDGVGNVSVSLVMERAVVQHDPLKISADTIKEIIEDRGFDAEVLASDTRLPARSGTQELTPSDEQVQVSAPSLSTTTLSVGGMTCGACTSAVEGAFKDVPGINAFSISLLSERVVIEHDEAILTPERIAEIIEDTGFDASVINTKITSTETRTQNTGRTERRQSRLSTTTVAIEGMTCGACTSAVEAGFKGVEGVVQFNISLLAERAVIVHDASKLPAERISEIIDERGFDARIISSQHSDSEASASSSTVQLKIYGLPSVEAATDLETILRSLSGIEQVSINFSTIRATIVHQPAAIGLRAIVDTIESAGFNALLAEADDNNAQLESLAKTKEIQGWRRAFYTSLSFAIPVFLTSMIFPMFLPVLDYGHLEIIPGLFLGDIVCLLLTIPVQFGIGKRFYVSAYKSLKHRSPTMDVLVVLGTSAAFFFSVAAMIISLIFPPHSRPATVFDTSTMLITFITLGRLLENGAKSQTSVALSRLMSLAPSMATIYSDPIAAERVAEDLDLEEAPEKADSPVVEKASEPADARRRMSVAKAVPTELIQVGDIVVLRPGDKVPADGTVLRGLSHADESMVTGEAMPIQKRKGSVLMAGTVNGAGRLDFKVTRAGRDTQLSQIVRLVQEAQTSRAPIQRMADMVAGYFVPVIISLGTATFIAWMVLSHVLPHPPQVFLDHESGGRFMVCLKLCISVIVFACPCALGLSTPTAVMVGTGVGAENGILVKGGAALEKSTKVTHVIFDKTGTLTTGKMDVTKLDLDIPSDGNSAAWIRLWWTAVGLAETSSEHPIGKAIVRASKDRLHLGPDDNFDGSVDKFEAVVGQGISAAVSLVQGTSRQTHQVLVGNASFLRSHMISVPTPRNASSTTDSSATALSTSAGRTVIYTALNAQYAGALYLSDTLKPTAAATISALRLMGIPSSIVTGDALPTALMIASAVDIPTSHVHASCSPDKKQAIIRELQAAGHTVAMVGDGINDSPALATADVGISLASGTDVAMEAADVVLMRPEQLMDVPASLHLAKTIFRRIKLNLIWACGYNLIGLPFAMGFFLPWGLSLHPMAAGAAMACSSVSVVLSSLALRWWRRPRWMDAEYLAREGRKPLKVGLRRRVVGAAKGLGEAVGLARLARSSVDRGAYVPLEDVETG